MSVYWEYVLLNKMRVSCVKQHSFLGSITSAEVRDLIALIHALSRMVLISTAIRTISFIKSVFRSVLQQSTSTLLVHYVHYFQRDVVVVGVWWILGENRFKNEHQLWSIKSWWYSCVNHIFSWHSLEVWNETFLTCRLESLLSQLLQIKALSWLQQ